MYTFVFMANRTEGVSQDILRRCAGITRKWMPALGVELAEQYTLLPECQSGWFWLAPACDKSLFLVSECLDQRYAVLVFGDIFDGGSRSAAQIVFDAWVSGGPGKVRRLEGCFSAVIVDRTDRSVVLIGDATGRRALSYWTDGRTLLASPHDIALMSTGRIPVEFDETSVCSVVAVEWSLRNRSLLKPVQTCHPAGYIRWADGDMRHVADPAMNVKDRIDGKDRSSVSSHLEHMVEIAQAQTRRFIENKPEIQCDLSAGLDSRVVWSLLLSVVDAPTRIIARSVGEPNCLDVRVARRLSRMFGTRFETYVDDPPSADEFVAHCDMLAFAMNGGTPGKRAIKYPTEWAPDRQMYACGSGGEIFRGYYYLHNPLGPRSSLSPREAFEILKKRTRLTKLPWTSQELPDMLVTRLDALVQEYAEISPNGYDILDMVYLYERMGVWGASTARQTWKNPRWSPFLSPQMVRMAYRMPPPIAHFATIHLKSLRRCAPRAYWVRMNGKLLPLAGDGVIKKILNKLDGRWQRARSRMQSTIGNKDMDLLAKDALTGPLLEIVREIVRADDSFARKIFGLNGVELLLKQHEARTHNHLEVLGFLVSMERWRTMIQGVAREGAAG